MYTGTFTLNVFPGVLRTKLDEIDQTSLNVQLRYNRTTNALATLNYVCATYFNLYVVFQGGVGLVC